MKKLKAKFSKFKDKKYIKNLFIDIITFLILQLLIVIIAVYTYGKTIGGEPKWYFYIISIIISVLVLSFVFKKRILSIKGITALILICALSVPVSAYMYTTFNKSGYQNNAPEFVFSGKVVEAHHYPLSKDKYHLISLTGENCTIYTNEELNIDNEPKITKYKGNFNMPIYIIEE